MQDTAGMLGMIVLGEAWSMTYVILVMRSTMLFIGLVTLCYGVLSTHIKALAPAL